jgi:hypothetical protein
VAAISAALLLSACGSQSSTPSIPTDVLQSELINQAPPSYSVNSAATGPLDLHSASFSTPADVSETEGVLARGHFAGGYVRVWQKGTDFITAAVYGFEKPQGATAFADFEAAFIKGEVGSYVYPLAQPDTGTGFVVTTQNKTKTKVVFCQGGVFSVEDAAFIVETCGQQPNSSAEANSLAAAAYFQAFTTLALPRASPAPSISPSPSTPKGAP